MLCKRNLGQIFYNSIQNWKNITGPLNKKLVLITPQSTYYWLVRAWFIHWSTYKVSRFFWDIFIKVKEHHWAELFGYWGLCTGINPKAPAFAPAFTPAAPMIDQHEPKYSYSNWLGIKMKHVNIEGLRVFWWMIIIKNSVMKYINDRIMWENKSS